jgi:membrane protease YdiL (CAAX protease family)
MSGSQPSAILDPARPCDPWKFWSTAAWTAAAIAAWVSVQFVVFFGIVFYTSIGDELAPGDINKLASHAVVLSSIAILAVPAEVGVVALAIRFARCRFVDYLALIRPSRSYMLIGLACLVVMLPLGDLSTWISGRGIVPPFVIEAYRSARDSGTIWLLTIALVIAAPLTEEIVFRGFMYRGLAASPVGNAGAILLPSAIWAAMHVQYETFFIVQIFLLGVVFGWLRWKSGSTLLTIMLHAIVNFSSLVQTVYLTAKMP